MMRRADSSGYAVSTVAYTVGCKSMPDFGTPGCRLSSRIYSRQYQTEWIRYVERKRLLICGIKLSIQTHVSEHSLSRTITIPDMYGINLSCKTVYDCVWLSNQSVATVPDQSPSAEQ